MNEDGVRVPKKAISEERLTFLCRMPYVDKPNCDVLFSHHVCSPATVTNYQRFAQSAKTKNPRSRPQVRLRFQLHPGCFVSIYIKVM